MIPRAEVQPYRVRKHQGKIYRVRNMHEPQQRKEDNTATHRLVDTSTGT